jgi:hypothetical protein
MAVQLEAHEMRVTSPGDIEQWLFRLRAVVGLGILRLDENERESPGLRDRYTKLPSQK